MKLKLSALAIVILIVGLCFTASVQSQTTHEKQWSQFRGTQGTGIAAEAATPPTQWDLKTQTAWQVEIPGTGWSSPVYESNKIWMTSAVTRAATQAEIDARLKGDRMAKIKTVAASIELHAICVDAKTGKIISDITLAKIDSPDPINPMNSYASPTPAIRDGKVICHFGSYGTWCVDEKTNQVLWDKQFVVKHSVGPGSSPVIFDDKVVLVCDGTDLQYIVTLDLATGNEVWKTNRPPIRAADGEYRKAYSTPVMLDIEGRKQVIVPGAQWIAGYDLNSGSEIWRAEHGKGFSITPMPVFQSGLIVFSTSYLQSKLVAVDPTGTGDVTSSAIAWQTKPKKGPNMPSMIGTGGQIYSVSDNGILRCFDAKSGKILNEARLGGNFSASPLLAGGNLYLASREGKLTVVKCSKDFETVSANQFESSIMASPILIGNDLLVRTEKKLIRIKGSTP
ncbi:MAG: outer membrane protein assembly factor BamB [Mariniblastus sp.]|jgi:outer membrane protein assembly factor BamB